MALREIFAEFGVEFDDEALKRGTASVDGAVKAVKAFGAMLAGNAIVQGIRQFADEFEQDAGRIQDSADRLGIGTTELQELNHAAKLGGVGPEEMAAALATLSRQAVAAGAGSKGAAAAFRALGVTTKEADGTTRPVADMLGDIAQGLDGVEDPAKRVALAQTLLGRSGRNLLTILKDGEGGLAALRGEFQSLGGGIDDATLAIAGGFGDAMDRWNVASDSLRARLANALLPILTRMVTWVTEAGAAFSRLVQGTHVVRNAIITLGIAAAAAAMPILIAWAPVIGTFLLIGAGIAAVVMIVDDLITMFEGGQSVIGEFIDEMFGVGTSKKFVDDLRIAWESLMAIIHGSTAPLLEAWDGMKLAWHDLFGGPMPSFHAIQYPAATSGTRAAAVASETRRVAAPAGTAARPVAGARTTTNHITVPGAGDPRAVAREVMRQIEARARTEHDADHPLRPGES